MKLLHFSDTHLGFSEYNKIDPESGLNQREQDFYVAWQQVMQGIFLHKPDVIIHAGDLFHTPRPSNRAIHVALESIQKISDAGIPFILISGNHETPRIRTTGSIFESIDLFPNVYAAYQSRYEKFTVNNIDFHCLPHCSLTEEMDASYEALVKGVTGDANVLISHGAWGGKEYGMGEFNEQRLPDPENLTGKAFNYIALGHYHRYVAVKENACYCSSTERTSLNEHDSTCGYLIVDFESGERTYHEIKTRAMIKSPAIDCAGMSTADIYQRLEDLADERIKEAIVQIQLTNIEQDAFLKLEMRHIDDMFRDAFILEKQLMRKSDAASTSQTTAKIEALPLEFERYINALENTELEKERLQKLGAFYLEGA
jgi:DNA repair protein SbcD/Mre11